jgi:hypothetical protein
VLLIKIGIAIYPIQEFPRHLRLVALPINKGLESFLLMVLFSHLFRFGGIVLTSLNLA